MCVRLHTHPTHPGVYRRCVCAARPPPPPPLRRVQRNGLPASGPLYKAESGELSNLRWDLPVPEMQYYWEKQNRWLVGWLVGRLQLYLVGCGCTWLVRGQVCSRVLGPVMEDATLLGEAKHEHMSKWQMAQAAVPSRHVISHPAWRKRSCVCCAAKPVATHCTTGGTNQWQHSNTHVSFVKAHGLHHRMQLQMYRQHHHCWLTPSGLRHPLRLGALPAAAAAASGSGSLRTGRRWPPSRQAWRAAAPCRAPSLCSTRSTCRRWAGATPPQHYI